MSSGSEGWSGSEGGFKKKSKKKEKSKDKDKKEKKDKDKSGDKDRGGKDKDKKDKKDKDKKNKDKDKDRTHEGAQGHSGASGHGFSGPGYGAPVGGGHAAEYFSSTTGSTPGHFQAPIHGQGAPPPPPYASAPGFPQAGGDIKSPQFPGAPPPPSMGGFPQAGVDIKSPQFPGAPPPPPMGGGFPQAGIDIKSPPLPGAPPPPPMGGNAPPPSGYRVPLRTDSSFPPPDQTGPPVAYEADGVSPVFIGSALFETSVQPCKLGPHLQPVASVPYGGAEYGHHGRYDLLPFVPEQMEWVHTGYGQIPAGRRPIEGGYEENGGKLYHALANLSGINVPGKTGEHLGGANVAYGSQEHVVQQYQILCWK